MATASEAKPAHLLYRVRSLERHGDRVEFVSVLAKDSFSAFQHAVNAMEIGTALECIVDVSDEGEWVKVANVRRNGR